MNFGLGCFFPRFNRPSAQLTLTLSSLVEKAKRDELKIEDILNEEELIVDFKSFNSTSSSELISLLKKEHLQNLIAYIIKEPLLNEHDTGYKFPFNACEILSAENMTLIDKFFELDDEISSKSEEGDEFEDLEEYEGMKIEKGKLKILKILRKSRRRRKVRRA
jgi:uncharacterized protein YdcH (DUF465 family)